MQVKNVFHKDHSENAASQYKVKRHPGLRWPWRRGTPLPIPNRTVKPASADGTATPGGRVGRRLLQRPNTLCDGAFFLLLSMPQNQQLEEKWNTYSHGLGLILGVFGMFLLLNIASDVQFISVLIYSLSVVLLFTASTLYHAVEDPLKKKKLRILDHISIYYLIAGTYTPVCLLVLNEGNGPLLLYLVWGTAILGTLLKIFFTGKFEVFSLVLYAVMGWMIVIDLNNLLESMSTNGLFYLSLGGAFYTIGILFYAVKKIPYNHLIWHFFVLGGAISHWIMVSSIL